MRRYNIWITVATLVGWAVLSSGCAERPSLIPNSDPYLRKTSSEFSSDAANRHPYPSDAPQGGRVDGRATVDYELNTVQVINLSPDDWNDIEVWVNEKYVCHVPRIEGNRGVRTLNFQMLYDGRGNHLPTKWETDRPLVQKVQILRDGTLYDLVIRLPD